MQTVSKGVYLKKDVVRVAEAALVKHVRIVAPSILPITLLVSFYKFAS